MNAQHPPIRESVERLSTYFGAHPQEAIAQDKPAVARLESGLRCTATGPKGETLVSDMPSAIGGASSAPTPGWYLRAALATCDATVIALRAAQLGIELTDLEVSVTSRSDNRGLIGSAPQVPAGPLDMQVQVRISAHDTSTQVLHELVRWAEAHSPVGDALRRAVPVNAEILVDPVAPA